MKCAACGAPKAFDQFIVDRPGCRGTFKLCEACWGEGENDEAWNETITQRIIKRRAAQTVASFERDLAVGRLNLYDNGGGPGTPIATGVPRPKKRRSRKKPRAAAEARIKRVP